MKLIYDNNVDGYNYKVYAKTIPVYLDHGQLDDDEDEYCLFLKVYNVQIYNILGKVTSFNIGSMLMRRLCETYDLFHKYNNTSLSIGSSSKIDLIGCDIIFDSINRHILLSKDDYIIIIDGLLADLQNILLKEI